MTLSPEYEALCERLEALACFQLGAERTWCQIPDGPEAAAAIRAQAARIEALEGALRTIANKTSVTFGRGTMSGEEAASIACQAILQEQNNAG